MTTIYFSLSIIFIMSSLHALYTPNERALKSRMFREYSKEFEGKKWDEYPDEFKELIKSLSLDFLFMFWAYFGLLTTQWVIFLTYLVLIVLVISPIMKITRYSILYTIINWFNALLKLTISIFVAINYFHLKINLTELLLNIL